MLKDVYEKYSLTIEDIYFADKGQKSKVDIVRYFQYHEDDLKNIKTPFSTNIINLNISNEEIFSKFRKSIKSEIHQAVKNHHVMTNLYYNPTVDTVDKFCLYYNSIAFIKKLAYANKSKLLRLKENILISNAVFDENIVVWHVYIFDTDRIRLLYSCSMQVKETELFRIVSKANKLLHYEDIKSANKKEYKIFDFGGISLVDDKVAGIDQFKLGFSKDIETTYHFIIGNTFSGKVGLFLFNFSNRIKNWKLILKL